VQNRVQVQLMFFSLYVLFPAAYLTVFTADQLSDIYRVNSIFPTDAVIRSSHFGDQALDTPGVPNAFGLETGRRSSVVMGNPSQQAGLMTIDPFSEILNPEYTNVVYRADAFDFGLDRLVTDDISLPSVFERDLTTSSLSITGSDWIQPGNDAPFLFYWALY
jgi:hypothetical protein